MTSSNADYVASLEARIEEYEKQMARSIPLEGKDFEFIHYAKNRHGSRCGISFETMEEFFSDAPPLSRSRKVFIAICTFIDNRIEWFKENWGGFLLMAFVITLFGSFLTAAILDVRQNSHNKMISEKIDQSISFDLNNDSIVTDDERRTVITKFITDNKLKVNEEDFYECIRNKKYYNFYNGEKKLSVDDIYDLITKKGVEK